jgi:hypothetical protein
MTHTTAGSWQAKRTDETRMVEDVLKNGGFQSADAYRYNSASIRVRVITTTTCPAARQRYFVGWVERSVSPTNPTTQAARQPGKGSAGIRCHSNSSDVSRSRP